MGKAQLALLLVDIQRDFWGPLAAAPHVSSFPANVRTLLDTARANQLAVVHTQAVFKANGTDWMLFYGPQGRGRIPCIAGSGGADIEEFAAPQDGEPVIGKQTFDGFVHTDLERVLRARNIQAVMVAGLETSVCVLFTAMSAYARRLVPLVVRDACADSAERHDVTLRLYDGLCFRSITAAQVRNDLASVVHLAARFADTQARKGDVQDS
jgi:ureidoacrylate peracid hydrolase